MSQAKRVEQSRGQFPRSWVAVGVMGFGLVSAPVAVGADALTRLTEQGVMLGTLTTAGDVGDLRFTVDLAGKIPTSSHVWVIVGGAQLRQRTNDGYWIPWSGRLDELIDNRFPVIDGRIEFKVVDGTVGEDNQGLSFVIAYKVGPTLKYGVYGVTPRAGSM